MAESLRIAVEMVGQEYVVARMGWLNKTSQQDHDQETAS